MRSVRIPGFTVKNGKVTKSVKHLDVSARLRQRGSKKVKVLGREMGSFRAPAKRPS